MKSLDVITIAGPRSTWSTGWGTTGGYGLVQQIYWRVTDQYRVRRGPGSIAYSFNGTTYSVAVDPSGADGSTRALHQRETSLNNTVSI